MCLNMILNKMSCDWSFYMSVRCGRSLAIKNSDGVQTTCHQSEGHPIRNYAYLRGSYEAAPCPRSTQSAWHNFCYQRLIWTEVSLGSVHAPNTSNCGHSQWSTLWRACSLKPRVYFIFHVLHHRAHNGACKFFKGLVPNGTLHVHLWTAMCTCPLSPQNCRVSC